MLVFFTKFVQKKISGWKQKKGNIFIEFWICKLAYVSSFSLNWQFWFLGQICTKRLFLVGDRMWMWMESECHYWTLYTRSSQNYPKRLHLFKNRKFVHHHWILNNWMSLGTKFQRKLAILIFGPNLPKNGISSQKLKKGTLLLNYVY